MNFKIFRRIANSPIFDRVALVMAIILLLSITMVLFNQIRTLNTSADQVSHSLTVDKEINSLFSQYDLMESAEFRSVILKDTTFEESYIDRKIEGDQILGRLQRLMESDTHQKEHLESVTKLKDSFHSTLTALHGKVNPSYADSTAMVYVDRAGKLLKDLRGLKQEMLKSNQDFLQDQLATYRRLTFLTPLTTLLLALFSIIVFTIAFFRLRRQKNQIQSSEMLLQNIVQSTDNIMNFYEPIYDSNGTVVDFKVVFANICNRDYLNLEPKDLVGKPISEVFPFVLKNNELQRMIDCYNRDETIDFERMVDVDGENYWFHTFVKAVDEGLLEVVRNNTEEFNAKESLLKANQELEVQNFIMMEAKKVAKIGSYTWNVENGPPEISDNFYRLLGCEPGEFVPTMDNYREFIHPEDLNDFDQYGEWQREQKKPRNYTYRIVTKQGKVKHLRTKGEFIEKEGESVLMGVVQDVTEQIAAENAMRVKNLELQRSNVELESFNRVVSHDLQEPLRKIQMFISRIDDSEMDRLSDRGKRYFDKINKVAARMQSLIRNLLTYSRIDNTHDNFEHIALDELLLKVQEDQSERINALEAELVWEAMPEVQGVVFQLEQLFSNLISNSLKYHSSEEAPKISIKSEQVAWDTIEAQFFKSAKIYHKITYTDNGIGFDNKNAGKIFEVFQRLHPKTKYSGTGIGLAICKKIVENHRGYIHASGELGKGSVFTIYLPS
ncbi:ATP-binding protein [Flagellimonas oceanensis]|uniref:ATP-binding protein n=1 Tax=Flagellimonas oceanensis TaxID=2499163 RepID=UPI000F8C93C5|nr:ATP-binding protein [Allomuricauda oceanensis]